MMTKACTCSLFCRIAIFNKWLLFAFFSLAILMFEMQPVIAAETVYLHPKIRSESLSQSVNTLSTAQLRPWLAHHVIVKPDSITELPSIVGSVDHRLMVGAGQTVFANGKGLVVGQQYGIYRKGALYQSNLAKLKFNFDALDITEVATATAIASKQGVTTLELNRSQYGEVRLGDIVMPQYQDTGAETGIAAAQSKQFTDARIIRVMGSIDIAAKNNIVTIDRGHLHGVSVGQILQIFQEGQQSADPQQKNRVKLPHQHIGQLVVFKVFEQLSYAFILESSHPIQMGALLAEDTL